MKLASLMYGASSVEPAGLAYDDPKVEGEHLASLGTIDDASLKKSLCFFEHEASGGLILDWENGSKVEVSAHFEGPSESWGDYARSCGILLCGRGFMINA